MLSRQNKRWVIHEKLPLTVDQELSSFPPFFRQILYGRGVGTAQQAMVYLEGQAENDDPFNLLDMGDAVDRLLWAIDRSEPIVVYGDYDVDGVTATALLVQVLRRYGGQVTAYIPNRFDEGYGLNLEAMQSLADRGVRVVVTVDCGIRSPREAELAKRCDIDLIISDHHHPGSELPDAYALICPKRDGDLYPEKDLSGVGLAYKIAQALAVRRPADGVCADDWLDLVALGTVADVVSLQGENRSLVRRGLQLIRSRKLTNRPGLYSLANVAGVKVGQITSGDIGYVLGPRLNAAGRLKTALEALDLLMAENVEQAGKLSQELENQNRERQDLTRKTQEEAIRQIQAGEDGEILFAFQKDYNPGIVGLVASRLVDYFYRPAIVGHDDGEFTRASCRSIPEFHITRALDECGDLLERHGGHALAAGFTVGNDRVEELMARMREIAARELSKLDLRPVLYADLELPLSQLHPMILEYMDKMQPTGQGNADAVFVSRNLKVTRARTVGTDAQHLKLTLTDGRITYDGIAFRQGYRAEGLAERLDILYQFERNEYNGHVNLQLNIRDLKPAGTPDK